MIDVINLTEHEVTFDRALGIPNIPKSGKIARVYFEQEQINPLNDIPVYRNVNGWIKGLPKPQPGIAYVVSGIVFQNALRPDVFSPNTQPWSVAHKTYGKVASVKGLIGVARRVT
jgi:hypothetical protein